MSLADLKKQSSSQTQRSFSIDEFIDDATNYAMGKPEIVSARYQKESKKICKALNDVVKKDKKASFKHATFTLTDDIITQLNDLSEQTNIPKSRLLRILVNQFYNEQNPVELQLSDVK